MSAVVWLDGECILSTSGQILANVHDESQCAGRGCCIHHPSEHHMRDWPLYWRDDRRMMERVCPHGVGHPDPDGLSVSGSVHGCDGCCRSLRHTPEGTEG